MLVGMLGLAGGVTSGGCRYGFTEQPVVARDAPAPHDAATDVVDIAIKTITFGERSGSMKTGVTRDATLIESDPAQNFGLLEDISIDGGIPTRERSLLRFDVQSIVPGTQVLAARLSLVVIDFGDQMTGGLQLYAPTDAWNEDVATWSLRDTGTSWSTAGGSVGAVNFVDFVPGSNESVIPVDTALVQGWVDNAATNNTGLIIVCADEALDTHYHFHSSESVQTANRPLLSIDVPM